VLSEEDEQHTHCGCGPVNGVWEVFEKTGDSCPAMGYNLIHAVHFAGTLFISITNLLIFQEFAN
jgi:hypothetical protein